MNIYLHPQTSSRKSHFQPLVSDPCALCPSPFFLSFFPGINHCFFLCFRGDISMGKRDCEILEHIQKARSKEKMGSPMHSQHVTCTLQSPRSRSVALKNMDPASALQHIFALLRGNCMHFKLTSKATIDTLQVLVLLRIGSHSLFKVRYARPLQN